MSPSSCMLPRMPCARAALLSLRQIARALRLSAAALSLVIAAAGPMQTLHAASAAAPAGGEEAAAREIERVVRRYYDHMEALDYAAMRAMSTDEFEILDRGYRHGHYPFKVQVDSSRKLGIKMRFVLRDFRTVVVRDVAYTSYVTDRPGYKYDGVDALILRRLGDRWLVDRFVHMRMVDGTDPHRVPGGQKALP